MLHLLSQNVWDVEAVCQLHAAKCDGTIGRTNKSKQIDEAADQKARVVNNHSEGNDIVLLLKKVDAVAPWNGETTIAE